MNEETYFEIFNHFFHKIECMPLQNPMKDVTTYTHLGLTLAIVVLLGFFGGYWVDGKLGTKPLLAIAGAFLGMTAGFINLVRTLNQAQKRKEEEEKDDTR